MIEPAEVSFRYIPDPASFFYELEICFGDRCEIVGGFAPDGGPDERLLRAAMWVLTGGEEAHVLMDPQQPWGVRLTFKAVPVGPSELDGRWPWGCEISRTDLDGNNEPETEPEVLGVTPSVTQMARAVAAYAEARDRGSWEPLSLIALRAALPLIEAETAGRGW